MKDEKKDYILNMMPDDIKNKLPKEFLKEIGTHKLKNYVFKYDYSKSLDEQPINDITREMLVSIYKDYLCSNDEKINYEKKLQKLINGVN